jgi:hypothetical protein
MFQEKQMRTTTLFAALATLALLASPAAAFVAKNGFSVTSTGPQEFVVEFRSARNETAYWCAAGDFVTRAMGLPSKTRIYRASPKPRGAGQGITFTLDPAAATPGGGLSNFGGAGDGSVSAGHARGSFCTFFEELPFQ